MRFHLLFLAYLISSNLFAQTLTHNQEKIIRGVIAAHFNDVIANGSSLHLGANSFVFMGNDTFLTLQGYHYLFRIKNDSAVRLDHSVFHGGNFERYLYTYNGSIHLMGGYGLFNTNNNIEFFDFKSGEWGVIKTIGNKPSYIRGLCLRKGDYIYSFYNSKNGNFIEEDEYDTYLYRLDLKTNTWTRFENLNTPEPQIFDKIYTKDYCIAVLPNRVLIINKNNLHFIYIPREQMRISIKDLFNYSVDENCLFYENYLSTPSNTVSYRINLDSIWIINKSEAVPLTLEPSWYQHKLVRYSAVILVIILIIIGAYKYVKRKSNRLTEKPITNNTEERINPIINKLLSTPKSSFTIEELDLLLEIDHMEFDSRKLKRHRLLSDLEKTHPGLIVRQKDETDKRRFIYTIQKNEQK